MAFRIAAVQGFRQAYAEAAPQTRHGLHRPHALRAPPLRCVLRRCIACSTIASRASPLHCVHAIHTSNGSHLLFVTQPFELVLVMSDTFSEQTPGAASAMGGPPASRRSFTPAACPLHACCMPVACLLKRLLHACSRLLHASSTPVLWTPPHT
eukprot:365293-Chlamydomonas_euryale.AAC.5